MLNGKYETYRFADRLTISEKIDSDKVEVIAVLIGPGLVLANKFFEKISRDHGTVFNLNTNQYDVGTLDQVLGL